jgi:hypothetical protein
MVEAKRETGREWKIAEIKRQIAAGVYDTPDRIDAAVDKIMLHHDEDTPEEQGGDSPRQPR